ncbi:MAG: hypothetical protein HUJ53_08280 [Holdemanella sp.]|nr:hypothetical protein [Holdemanella sp.]
MSDISQNNKRIAKNTILMYIRMFFIMAISLYISRVVLKELGVEDFGIYTAVGGFVAMFGILTNSLGAAISRFITFELGRGDKVKLTQIFGSSLMIQIFISLAIIIAAETIGVWFLNTQMNIPEIRMNAANNVLQFSLLHPVQIYFLPNTFVQRII